MENNGRDNPDIQQEQDQITNVPLTPQFPMTHESKNIKKIALIIVLIVVSLLGGTYTAWILFIRKDTKQPVVKTNPQQQQVVEKLDKPSLSADTVIVLVEGDDVLLFYPATNKTEKIISGIEPGVQAGGETVGNFRYVDLSPDGSKVAVNLLNDGNNQPSVGYYDRETKKTVVIAKGENPIWSPQGNRVAFFDEEAVKVYDLDTKKTVAIKDSRRPLNTGGYINGTPPLIMGWKSTDEIVFDARDNINDVSYSIGNATTGENTKIRIQSLSDEQSLRAGVVSYDGSKILASVDKDPGYDAGIMEVDGTAFKSVSGNSADRWAGSGFDIAGWSPDGQKVVVVDNFMSASAPAGQMVKSEYQVKDLQGNQLFAITGERAHNLHDSDTQYSACWVGEIIYLVFYVDDGKPYLGAYDTTTKKITKLYTFPNQAVGGLGCPR